MKFRVTHNNNLPSDVCNDDRGMQPRCVPQQVWNDHQPYNRLGGFLCTRRLVKWGEISSTQCATARKFP